MIPRAFNRRMRVMAVLVVAGILVSTPASAGLHAYDGFGEHSIGDNMDTPLTNGFAFDASAISASAVVDQDAFYRPPAWSLC